MEKPLDQYQYTLLHVESINGILQLVVLHRCCLSEIVFYVIISAVGLSLSMLKKHPANVILFPMALHAYFFFIFYNYNTMQYQAIITGLVAKKQ